MILAFYALLAAPLAEPVRGDFDRDGREDVASVIANNDDLVLVVDLASDETLHVVTRFDKSKPLTIRNRPATETPPFCPQPPQVSHCSRQVDVLEFAVADEYGGITGWNGRFFDVVRLWGAPD